MKKNAGMALVLCLVIWQSPTAARAQTLLQAWVNTGAPSVVPAPAPGVNRAINLAATNRPAVGRGNVWYDHVDVYMVWPPSDVPGPKSVSVGSEQYICSKNGCGGPHFVWRTLAGVTPISNPTAVGWQNHREVFVVGSDHSLWHNVANSNDASSDASAWSGWASLGQPAGGLCTDPSAAAWIADASSPITRIDVFAMDCGGNLQHIWYANGAWQKWEVPLSTLFTTRVTTEPPIAVSINGIAEPYGTLHVLYRDANGLIADVHCEDSKCSNDQNSWSYLSTGMQTCSASANLAATTTHSLIGWSHAALVLDCAQNLNASWFDTMLDVNWESPRTTPASGRPSATDGGQGADVFFTDANGKIQYRLFRSAGWQSQAGPVGSDTFTGPPVAVLGEYPKANLPNAFNWIVYVFANKSDGRVWYTTINGNQ